MKNKLKESRLIKNILKLGFIIAGCFVLASFSPSLDGRAVVVEPGVFPEGLFAKTVGYLPGDIISVTNITGDATIDILVIGALDPSEGVAIMLSPEAAAAIGINKNSNNIVKITKRSNQDERVYGSAVIASNGTAAPAKEEPVVEPVKEPVVEDIPYSEPAEGVTAPVYEEWEEPVFDEKETVPATQPKEEIYSKPIEEPVEEEPVKEYEYFDDEALPEYFEDDFEEEKEPEYIEETTAVEEPVEEAPVREETPVVYEEFKDDELEDLPTDEEPAEEFETIPAEEEPVEEEIAEEAPVEEPAEEPVEEAFEEEPIEEEFTDDEPGDVPAEEEEFIDDETLDDIPEEEEPVEETPAEEPEEEAYEEPEFEEEEFGDEEFVEEEPIEEKPIEEEPVEEIPEDEVIPEEEDWSDEPEVLDDEEEYDAIVLVPADDNPPVYEEEEETEEALIPDVLNNVVNINNDIETVVVQPASTGNETSYDKFMIESLNELEAEKYYIQIATLRDDENILEIVNKYGTKYPITIVPTANGSKQVLVGPVTLDEYGTVLARFKAYGYKDAFLRKGTNPNPKARGSAAGVDAK